MRVGRPAGTTVLGQFVDERVWKRRLDAFYAWLTRPVHASSLCLFRIVYSYVMMAQIIRWGTMFDQFETSVYTLHYPGVSWIRPVSPALGNLMLSVCFISSVSLGVGFMTRTVSVINYVLFAYLFHICHSNYNNHYVLMCHINFVGCFVNWGTWGSLDAFLNRRFRRPVENTVPYWNLWLMQLLFCVPYFWGSVAKMNHDWLFRAEPLITWFAEKSGWFYRQWWFPWCIAWTGMMYDLLISPLLFWKKTRFIIGFPGAIFFNCSNKLMFNIGVFPFAMIASLVLFLDPDHPAKWWHVIITPPPPPGSEKSQSEPYLIDKDDNKYDRHPPGKKNYKRFVLIFVFGFLLFHTLYPLRHFFLYKSNPSWTEEGHTGAWHMKLRSKWGWIYLEFHEANGNVTKLSPSYDPFLNRSQLRKVECRPEDILTYAARLKQVFEEAERPITAIYAHSCFTLNSNPYKQLYIPTTNLVEWIGNYELIGVSGVDKWIYAYDDAPSCDRHSPLRSKTEAYNQSVTDHQNLYMQANIFDAGQLLLRHAYKRNVYHVSGYQHSPERVLEPAYVWNMW